MTATQRKLMTLVGTHAGALPIKIFPGHNKVGVATLNSTGETVLVCREQTLGGLREQGKLVRVGAHHDWTFRRTGKCKCGAPEVDADVCPYDEDVHGEIYLCNCCADCRHACFSDI